MNDKERGHCKENIKEKKADTAKILLSQLLSESFEDEKVGLGWQDGWQYATLFFLQLVQEVWNLICFEY